MTASVEEMLLHQNFLNIIEQRLSYWAQDVDGTSFDYQIENEHSEEFSDSGDVHFLSQEVLLESLDLFRTIRSVIFSNGADKSVLGHFKVIVETFLRYLSPCIYPKMSPPPDLPNDFKIKTASFGFLLWLLCLPPSICPTSDEDVHPRVLSSSSRLRLSQASQIVDNPMVYRSLLQICELCLASSHEPNSTEHEEDDLTHDPSVFSGSFFMIQVLRISHCLTSKPPRKACQELLVRCLSHEDQTIRKSVGQILSHCVVSHIGFNSIAQQNNEDSDDVQRPSFLQSLTRVIREELSSILSSAVEGVGSKKQKKLKALEYSSTDASLSFTKLNRLLGFVSQLLPHLPAESQIALLTEDLFGQFSGESGLGFVRHPKIPLLGLRTISDYFVNFCPSPNCPSDESWAARKRVLNCLITRQFNSFNALRISAQIRAIFDGLSNLIEFMDNFSGGESEIPRSTPVCIARRSDIFDLVKTMVEDPKSFFRTAMVETDPTIQHTVLEGWTKLLKGAAGSYSEGLGKEDNTGSGVQTENMVSGGIILYSTIVPAFLSLLSYKFKPIWKNVFMILTAMFDSIQQLSLSLYSCLGKSQSQIIFSAFISTVGRSGDRTPTEIQSLLVELTTTLNNASVHGFGQFYRSFSQYLFNSLFRELLERLASILNEVEEPSKEALSILDSTVTGQLSLDQLKSREAGIYRNDLRRCVGCAFRVFGSRSMLTFSSLSLDQLPTLSLTSPTFAYESNSWVLPLMAEFVARDELRFFESYFLQLARELGQKGQTIGTGELGFIESRHYRRLVEQIWCLLPAFFREPLDLMTGLADGQIINAMIGELDKPVIKDHVCTAIGTLCRHITPFLESDAADLPYDTTEFPFMQRMWHEISQNNPTALRLQSTKLMGVLTVKFLQAHRPTAGLSGVSSHQSQSSRGAQMLLEAIRALVALCDPQLLESNLLKFSTTWQTAVASAAAVVVSPDSIQNKQLPLSPTDYGALVDVVDALVPQLPEVTVARLFGVFLQLLRESAEGLDKQTNRPSSSFEQKSPLKASLFKGSARRPFVGRKGLLGSGAPVSAAESSRQTLQCLLRRSFKGLKHVCERIEKSIRAGESREVYDEILTTDKLAELWQTISSTRNSSRSAALKSRMAFLRSYINLISAIANHNEEVKIIFVSVLKDLAPEVLLGLSETNKTIRAEALDLLQAMALAPVSLEQLIVLLLPGLGSTVPAMKSSTIIALVALLRSHGDLMPRELIGRIAPLALSLLKDEDKQVFRCALSFVRVLQRRLSVDDVPEAFKAYIELMLRSPHTLSCRVVIRHIIDKAIKKVGVPTLEPLFPESDLPLLHYVDRSLRRRRLYGIQKRLAEERNDELNKEHRAIVKPQRNSRPVPKEQESDSGDGDDDEIFEFPTNRRARAISNEDQAMDEPLSIRALLDELQAESDEDEARGKRHNTRKGKRLHADSNHLTTHIVENAQPMDLLSPDHTHSSLAVRESRSAKRARITDVGGFKVGSDGRFMITDEENDKKLVPGFGAVKKPDGSNPFLPSAKNTTLKRFTRKSLSDLKEKRNNLKAAKQVRRAGHYIQKSADSFKSSRGAGDVKKSSGAMPYACIRLNPSMLREKRRAESVKSFKENARISGKASHEKGRKKGRK